MEDDELEALRQKRLLELQAQAHAEEAGYDRAEEEHIRAQREALLRQLFTPIPITDELLKSVLGQIQGHKREITIKRV
jgi:DNA-binding TFAR19-related protein (PDSD5 family)